MRFELIVKNGKIVFPTGGVVDGDIGVVDGRIAAIARDLNSRDAERVIDASGKVVMPGVVDGHEHIGIYRPFKEDAVSESRSAVTGGVTTILSYFRTGRHYLNVSGPYRDILGKLLDLSRDSFITDYGFNLAPMSLTHIEEIPDLVKEFGVATFKYYMFYKGMELRGSEYRGRGVEREYLLSEEPYDNGFLYNVMDRISSVNREGYAARLSIHCEDPEIIRVHMPQAMERLKRGEINDLEAYSQARPPKAEAVSIATAISIAKATGCPINILHVSSGEALEAAVKYSNELRDLDIVLEAVIHHLVLTTDRDVGTFGKVNPPIRSREDVEALWEGIARGYISVVGSDHAAAPRSIKEGDVWTAMPGFGGNTLILPVMISEGYFRRGLPLDHIARLVSYNPAKIHGLQPRKGDISLGADADLVIVDLDAEKKVTPEILNSAQEYTPFEGLQLKGWPYATIIRGEVVFEDGEVIGKPGHGEYIKRPVEKHYT